VLTTVSEWAVDEVMITLGLSSPAASRLLAESVGLVEQLPATLAALEVGTISWAHAQMLVEVLTPMSDPAKRAAVEARLLARAAGRTVTQLRASSGGRCCAPTRRRPPGGWRRRSGTGRCGCSRARTAWRRGWRR
jgi:hypothetical protein